MRSEEVSWPSVTVAHPFTTAMNITTHLWEATSRRLTESSLPGVTPACIHAADAVLAAQAWRQRRQRNCKLARLVGWAWPEATSVLQVYRPCLFSCRTPIVTLS